MGDCVEKMFAGFCSIAGAPYDRPVMDQDEDLCGSMSSDESGPSSSSASSDLTEDATSSTTLPSSPSSSLSPPSSGPLYDLAELMAHLPIKRGLSGYFEGKSQSFTSLSNVRCIEDLAKKENPYRKRMKSCKSYGGGLDCHKSFIPRTCTRTISKRTSRGSFSSLLARRNNFISGRPPIPLQKNM